MCGTQRSGALNIARAFGAAKWELVRTITDWLEWSPGWSAPTAQRVRFVLDFGYWAGLRTAERVGVTLGGIETAARGERWLHLTGNGVKIGKVVLSPLARFALDQYLAQRGLPANLARWSPDSPLLEHFDAPSGITTPRLREVLHRFFHAADDGIESDRRHSRASCGARCHIGCATRTLLMHWQMMRRWRPCATTCGTRRLA